MWAWFQKIFRKDPQPAIRLTNEEIRQKVMEAAKKVVRYGPRPSAIYWEEMDIANEIMGEFMKLVGNIDNGTKIKAMRICRTYVDPIRRDSYEHPF